MEIGMMWFCENADKSLGEKIDEAVAYYTNKYLQIPNVVFIHPSMYIMADLSHLVFSHIVVRLTENMPQEHLWLGVSNEPLN